MKHIIALLTTIILLTSIATAQNYSVGFNYMDGYASSDATSETIFQGVTSFTVETWYKNPGTQNGSNSSLTQWGSIITNYRRYGSGDPYNNFGLRMSSNASDETNDPGVVTFFGNSSNEQLDDDEWHHLAGVYDHDNGISYLFVDGILNDTSATSGDYLSSYNKLYINSWAPFAGEFHYECSVANVRITDGVRYSSNFSPEFPLASESNSIIALDFTTGSGTTLSDLSGNGNDFTLYDGATWSTDVPFTGSTTTSDLTWSVQAKVSQGSYSDNDNYLGVADGATNGFDASLEEVEAPASPGSSVSLYFPHSEWNYSLGDNFSKDVRPEVAQTDTMQVWDFEVLATDAGDATLTFVFTDVPSVPVILENTATGARQTLSNNATYTFTVVADSAHPFRISIGDTTTPSLALGASCTGPAILNSDSTQALSWTTSDGFTVDSIEVWFSSDSGTTYNEVTSISGTNSYNWTVPDTTINL